MYAIPGLIMFGLIEEAVRELTTVGELVTASIFNHSTCFYIVLMTIYPCQFLVPYSYLVVTS